MPQRWDVKATSKPKRAVNTTLELRQMNINTITEAFEFLRMDGSQSLALLDCMNAFALGKDELEKHFDSHLWLTEAANAEPFVSEEAKQYYIELSGIEEFLVANSLIYND